MDRWIWYGSVSLLALVVVTGSSLVAALLLGVNNPRPIRSPDWQADDFVIATGADSKRTSVVLMGQFYTDFTLEVKAQPVFESEFANYGLVYHAHDETHYDVFAVGSDGYYAVWRVAEDRETVLLAWQQFPHVNRHLQDNLLRVTCAGSVCRFYINDEYAATITDDASWSAGDVGLWVQGQSDIERVTFSHLKVWSMDNW
jgi:hypothetical protein